MDMTLPLKKPRATRAGILALALGAAALSGCATGPQNAQQTLAGIASSNATVVRPAPVTAQLIDKIAVQRPTQAMLLDVLRAPATEHDVAVSIPGPAGTLVGTQASARHARGIEGAGAVAVGGKLGVFMGVTALLMGDGSTRTGTLPVLTEPTLDFYRPLSAAELQTPLQGQGPLFQSEVDVVSALHNGKPATFMGSPCLDLHFDHFAPGAGTVLHFFRYSRANVVQGPGYFIVHDSYGAQFAQKGLPIGDNGYILFGIEPDEGMAFVQPGELPNNAYFSVSKLQLLEKKDPDIRNWYAVFNVAGGKKPGTQWAVVHDDKLVSMAHFVVPTQK